MITSAPPEFILTDTTGVVIATSGSTASILSTSGASTGDVLTVQGDGTLDFATPVVTESLTDLNEWAANTLTVPGALTVRQAGGVAGTDEVQIYHDGTNAYIDAQSGDLIFNNSNAKVNSSGEFTNNAGLSGQERFGAANNGGGFLSTSLGYNTTVASGTVAVGYQANGHNRSVAIGRDAGGGFQNIVAIGSYATGIGLITAGVSAIAIGTGGSTATSTRVHAAAGECVIGGQGGISNFYLGGYGAEYGLTNVTLAPGGRTGTDLDGFDLILAGGKPTGAGTPGQVQFQVAPAGASGTTLGTLTTVGLFDEQGLTVRQAGGVAGTDEVQIYHDGSDAYISPKSGNLNFGTTNLLVNGDLTVNDRISSSSTKLNLSQGGTDRIVIEGGIVQINQGTLRKRSTIGYLGAITHPWNTFFTEEMLLMYDFNSSSDYEALSVNGTAGEITLTAQSLGTGSSNIDISLNPLGTGSVILNSTLTVRQPGGVAGTDEVQIYHDGTDAHVDSQSGDLIFNNSNAKVNSSGEFTNNQGQSRSEAFGIGATLHAIDCVAIGYNAKAGDSSSGTHKQCTAIGSGAVAVISDTAIGFNSNASFGYGVAIGANSSCTAYGAVAIGQGATAAVFGVAIGQGTTNTGSGVSIGRGASGPLAIGYNATSSHAQSFAIGTSANGTNISSMAIGGSSSSTYLGSIALGRSATATKNYQLVIGSDYLGVSHITNVYIGKGVTNAAPADVTYNATGGSGTDISGANLILAGGKPTGAGTSGQVQFQVAPAGASGTTLGTLTTVGLFDEQGLTVRQPGGVAGTDEVQIYHDGTDAHIIPQSGILVVPTDIKATGLDVSGDIYDSVGSVINILDNIDLATGVITSTSASLNLSCNGNEFTLETDANNNGIGKFHFVDGGDEVLTIDDGVLKVLQPGGVAGTDELQIYHDGTDAYIQSQSDGGSNLWISGPVATNAGIQIYSNGTAGQINYYTRGVHRFYEDSIEAVSISRTNFYSGTTVDFALGLVGSANRGIAYLCLDELSSDPSDPSEGQSVLWQSDGTGSGDDGDIMIKITAGGVTKTTTLIDFSTVIII